MIEERRSLDNVGDPIWAKWLLFVGRIGRRLCRWANSASGASDGGPAGLRSMAMPTTSWRRLFMRLTSAAPTGRMPALDRLGRSKLNWRWPNFQPRHSIDITRRSGPLLWGA